MGLLLALLTFAIWGQTTRKVQVAGVVLPPGGLLQMTSPQAARLHRLLVQEGEQVRPNQVLAVLDLSVRSDRGNSADLLNRGIQSRQAALELETRSLQARVMHRQQSLRDRLRSLQTDLEQAQGELDVTQRRLALAEQGLKRDEGLAAQGFLSNAQLQTKQEELLDHQVRERNARRNLEGLRRETVSVEAEIAAAHLEGQTQQAQLDRTHAELAQERAELAARHLQYVTAPTSATVGAITAQRGQSLQSGQNILSLLPGEGASAPPASQFQHGRPNPASAAKPTYIQRAPPVAAATPLQAQLYAPSRAAGFVTPGQDVWLRLHAFPYQKFGMLPGKVTGVSRTPVQPQDLPAGLTHLLLAAAQTQEPLYRITVALHTNVVQAFGQPQPLKAGMTLDADVIQDRRTIWEWVFEPLLAARQRWQIPSNGPSNTSPGGV